MYHCIRKSLSGNVALNCGHSATYLSLAGIGCSQKPGEDGQSLPTKYFITKHVCFYKQLWKTINMCAK